MYIKFLYISAWASALLVQLRWAMRRPLCAGRVTGTDSRAFSFYVVMLISNFMNRPVRESAGQKGISVFL